MGGYDWRPIAACVAAMVSLGSAKLVSPREKVRAMAFNTSATTKALLLGVSCL